MIVNMDTSVQDTLVRRIVNSQCNFHLTGSRFFGGAGPKSDYDFFVNANDPDLMPFLCSNNGLFRQTEGYGITVSGVTYGDPSVVEVWASKRRSLSPEDNVHIQVILPDWFNEKVRAQEVIQQFNLLSLARELFPGSRRKEAHKLIWSSVLRTLRYYSESLPNCPVDPNPRY